MDATRPDAPASLDCRCRCGTLRATLRIAPGARRIVCHCRDCQAFQHALGAADAVLDAHGGTDLAALSPASLKIDAGRERLAALRLYPKGLLRWYAACCDTPLGNTPPQRALAHFGAVVAPLVETNGAEAVEAALGPVRARIYGAQATNGAPPGAHPKVPLSMIPPVLAAMIGRFARGEHRRSPFFDARGEPAVRPRTLSDAEREGLAPYGRG